MTIYSIQSAAQALMETMLSAENKKTFIFLAFISLTAIFSGFFFGICLPDTDASSLMAPVIARLTSAALPLSSLIANLIFLLVLYLSGFLIWGVVVSLPLLVLRFFAFGFCGFLFLLSDGAAAGFSALFLISHMLLVPLFILAELTAIRRGTAASSPYKEYNFIYLLLACLVLLFSIIQAVPVST